MPARRPSCLVYDLYLETMGGGEAVVLVCADELSRSHRVVVCGPRLPERAAIKARGWPCPAHLHHLPVAGFTAVSAAFDVVLYLANGPPLPSLARRSIGILQFPIRPLSGNPVRGAVERAGLRRYDWIVYSDFVAGWARQRYGMDATILHPPVRLGAPGTKKDNVILSIGRFFGVQHCKRQDVLIEAFRQLPLAVREGWELVLAGGCGTSADDRRYLKDLRAAAAGLPIHFAVDVDRPSLERYLSSATLYWHATGFGRSPDAPHQAEHFGISVVEAMSWGAVPLVYDDGGPPDVVADGGVSWRSVDDLVAGTVALIQDPARRQAMARRSVQRSQEYGEPVFRARFRSLVEAGSGSGGRAPRRTPT